MTEKDNILQNLVRIGKVSAINDASRKARVRFEDKELTSAWLYVLANPPFIHIVDHDRQNQITESGYGPDEHVHEVKVKPWMPNIGDTAICLFLPVFNGDGIVLGVV